MKRIVQLLALGGLALSAPAQTTNGEIRLNWYYPSNSVWQANQNNWPFSFVIRATNTLSNPSNWPVVMSINYTNAPIVGFDGTNYLYSQPFQVNPIGQMFFVATSSNFWGESSFSVTKSVPSMAIPLQASIIKN